MDNLADVESWLDHTKAISDYRLAVRSAVRRLWLGESTVFDFFDTMNFAITRHLRIAWKEGAASCGINEDELTNQEIAARDSFINSQFPYLLGFGDSIEENNKSSGAKLEPHLQRAELWIGRYSEAREKAKTMACGDQKLQWVVGPTEHCEDCARLNGRVYRASVWERYGLRPQSRDLACGGWRCQCTLVPTSEPATRGRPPGLRGPRR